MLSGAYAKFFYDSNKESILQIFFNLIIYLCLLWILVMILSLIRVILYLSTIVSVVYGFKFFFYRSEKFRNVTRPVGKGFVSILRNVLSKIYSLEINDKNSTEKNN